MVLHGRMQGTSARIQLLQLARELPHLANAKSKPVGTVLSEARARLQAIEDSLGGEQQPFTRITAAELATGKFDLTDLGTLAQYVSGMSGERQDDIASDRSLRVGPVLACFKPSPASGPTGRTNRIARASGPGL